MTRNQLDQLRKDAEQYGAASILSENTRRGYTTAFCGFAEWAWPGETQWPLPADPAIVAGYLMARAEAGKKAGTIARDIAAISHAHRKLGLDNPCDLTLVRNVWGRLRRDLAIEGRAESTQALGLTEAHLDRIRETACEPRPKGGNGALEAPVQALRRGLAAIATVSLMRDGLLRRSEAVRITWADLKADGGGAGILTIRRSKTSVLSRQVPLRPVTMRDLKAIRPKQPDPTDRVLGVRSCRAINNRIKSAARYAGLGDGFSGHSCRVGMAQDLAVAGASSVEIANAGRWKTAAMAVRYSRNVASSRSAVIKYL